MMWDADTATVQRAGTRVQAGTHTPPQWPSPPPALPRGGCCAGIQIREDEPQSPKEALNLPLQMLPVPKSAEPPTRLPAANAVSGEQVL